MTQGIAVDRIPEGEFGRMRQEWNSLLERSVTNEIFLLWEWMYSWWDVFKNGSRELYLLRGRNSRGETIGIAPFYLEKQRGFGNARSNTVRFCSSVETYPDHLDIITTKVYEQSFAEAVLNYLIRHEPEWDLIRLDGVHENAMIKKYLASPGATQNGVLMTAIPSARCPYLAMENTFEDYIKSFSSKKRQTLLRKRKILLDREKARLKTVGSDEEPEKHLQELFALHQERAMRKGIKTNFAGERLYRFHSRTTHYLLKEGKVLLAFLSKGFPPLVSYYCFKHNQKYYYFQAGLSDEGEKRSAGTVLFSLIIEHAFKEGSKEFDFLRGSEEYKFYWTKDYRKDYSLIVRKDNLVNRLTYYFHAVVGRTLPRIQKIYKPAPH